MSNDSIIYLGAPSQALLSDTWRSSYLHQEQPEVPHATPAVTWRRLVVPAPRLIAPEQNDSHESAVLTEEATVSNISDTTIPTQLPEFDFDMSAVLDLEDIYHLSMPARASLLAVILHQSSLMTTRTKNGETVMLVLTLGDATSNGFELTIWGPHALYVAHHVRRMDVILIHDVSVSLFRDQVVGQSRYNSRFTLLYRIDRRGKEDDQFRPLLVGDLQSERVAAVRDWALTWVPSEIQPQDTQE